MPHHHVSTTLPRTLKQLKASRPEHMREFLRLVLLDALDSHLQEEADREEGWSGPKPHREAHLDALGVKHGLALVAAKLEELKNALQKGRSGRARRRAKA